MSQNDERQLTSRDAIYKLGQLPQEECNTLRNLGLSHIADLDHISVEDLEGAGVSPLIIGMLNERLEHHGFNPVL